MNTPTTILAGLLACALIGLSGCTGDDAALAEETEQWHADRLERLTAEDGWLSLVGLEWLNEGPNRVGSDPECEVVYAGFPADHIATVIVRDGWVRIEPAPLPAGLSLEGIPEVGTLIKDTDGTPTIVSIGTIRFHVIERDGRLALRIKDANAPTRTGFAGMERYPVDPAWRITARFEPPAKPGTIEMKTVIEGVDAESEIFGWAVFEQGGHTARAVLFPAGNGGAYLRFGDATNHAPGGTYPIGRYLSIPAPADDGTVVLDFNRSYNPPCAFTRYATCTLPPQPNDFPFPIDAGERWTGE